MRALGLAVLVGSCAAPLRAQTLSRIDAASERVAANEPVTLRIEFEPQTGQVQCAFRINYGDGDGDDVPVERLPVILEKRYAKPATYVVTVEGKSRYRGILNIKLACQGPVLTKTLTVYDRAAEEAKEQLAREMAAREAAIKEEKARLEVERQAFEAAQQKAREIERQKAAAAAAAATSTTKKAPGPASLASGVVRPK